MKAPGNKPVDVSARERTSVVQRWQARVAATYPAESARRLLEDADPFRNPFGRVLREQLPVLFDEISGDMDWSRIRPALDEIVRVRAVQDFTAGQAVGFLLPLKQVIRAELNPEPDTAVLLDQRIDQILLAAFDTFAECRERIGRIQVEAAKRRVFVLEKMAAGR